MRHWDTLLSRIPADRPITGAEVGVLRGENAEHLLRCRPLLSLLLVDDWSLRGLPLREREDGQEIKQQAWMRLLPYNQRITWVNLTANRAAVSIPDASIDYAFLDADHSYFATISAVSLWRPKVRLWLAGHDYGHPDFPHVKLAVDTYAVQEHVDFEVLGRCWFMPPLERRADASNG